MQDKEKELLNELRKVQSDIDKIKFVKDTKYEKYNSLLRDGKYTMLLEYLKDISDGMGVAISQFSDINGSHKRTYYQTLKDFNQIITDFLNDVETDDRNELIRKGLKQKEAKIKSELGIK